MHDYLSYDAEVVMHSQRDYLFNLLRGFGLRENSDKTRDTVWSDDQYGWKSRDLRKSVLSARVGYNHDLSLIDILPISFEYKTKFKIAFARSGFTEVER